MTTSQKLDLILARLNAMEARQMYGSGDDDVAARVADLIADRFTTIENRLHEGVGKIDALGERMDNLPTKEDLRQLRCEIEDASAVLNAVTDLAEDARRRELATWRDEARAAMRRHVS